MDDFAMDNSQSVNIKCYLKLETLDINPSAIPDYYLVLSGPRSKASNSKGATGPWSSPQSQASTGERECRLPTARRSGETVRALLGHADVRTTMLYTHVLNRGGLGVRSPADEL